jgi:CelD/BcsL family acetyltransferase involved in cellulose biosynthesis
MAAPFWIDNASAFARQAAGSVVGASERRSASRLRHIADRGLLAETLSVEDIGEHAEAWRALAARALEPNVFFEPGFALALARHGATRPRFVALWRDASRRELAGLFPLGSTRLGLAHIWLDPQTPLATPLINRDAADVVLRTLFKHLRETEGAVGLVFPRLTQSGAAVRAITAAAGASGRGVETLCAFERAALYAGSDADALARRGASNHTLRELYRRRRRLEERGAVAFSVIGDPRDIESALEEFLALEASGWKGSRGALLRDDDLACFAREATRQMARGRQCQIARLALDGAPIAMGILFQSGDQAYFWKIAFDECFRAFAPGVDLVHRLTGLLASRDDIALTDSCAIAHHPMIDRFWPDRLGVCDVAVALCGERPGAFRAACIAERFRRGLRERVKRVVNGALRRKVS